VTSIQFRNRAIAQTRNRRGASPARDGSRAYGQYRTRCWKICSRRTP